MVLLEVLLVLVDGVVVWCIVDIFGVLCGCDCIYVGFDIFVFCGIVVISVMLGIVVDICDGGFGGC